MNKFEKIYRQIISEMNYNNKENLDDTNISVKNEKTTFNNIVLTSKYLKKCHSEEEWQEPYKFNTFDEALTFLYEVNDNKTNIRISPFYFNNLYYYEDGEWKSDILYGEDKESIISMLEKYTPIVLKSNKQLKLQVNSEDMAQYDFTLTLQ